MTTAPRGLLRMPGTLYDIQSWHLMRTQRPELLKRVQKGRLKFKLLDVNRFRDGTNLPRWFDALAGNAISNTCAEALVTHNGKFVDGFKGSVIFCDEIISYVLVCHELIRNGEKLRPTGGTFSPASLLNDVIRFDCENLLTDEGIWTMLPESMDDAVHRLMSAFALWCIELSLRATKRDDQKEALSQLALASESMYYAGWGVGATLRTDEKSWVNAKKGDARWENDPTQEYKLTIFEEWERWQADRSLYRYPRDFRKAMFKRFPEAVDGTLKNWMSKWGRGEKP